MDLSSRSSFTAQSNAAENLFLPDIPGGARYPGESPPADFITGGSMWPYAHAAAHGQGSICIMYLEKIRNTAPKVPELVMRAIMTAIEDGRIKLNEDLLPERDLAAALGVGRGSLRECLAILEFLGVIEARGNRKVVVKNTEYIQNAISLIKLPEKEDTMPDFMEFRKVNECAIVELACERATEEDLTAVKECVDRMEQDPLDAMADIEFHLALAAASHNIMFDTTIRMVNTMIFDLRYRFLAKPHFHLRTLRAHRAIYEAVARRDKNAAREAMLHHLQTISNYPREADVAEVSDMD